jgi:hypothetical protein
MFETLVFSRVFRFLDVLFSPILRCSENYLKTFQGRASQTLSQCHLASPANNVSERLMDCFPAIPSRLSDQILDVLTKSPQTIVSSSIVAFLTLRLFGLIGSSAVSDLGNSERSDRTERPLDQGQCRSDDEHPATSESRRISVLSALLFYTLEPRRCFRPNGYAPNARQQSHFVFVIHRVPKTPANISIENPSPQKSSDERLHDRYRLAVKLQPCCILETH